MYWGDVKIMGFIKAFIYRNNPDYCTDCGNKLTDIEKEYYIHRCERCERKAWERLYKEDRREDKKWKNR